MQQRSVKLVYLFWSPHSALAAHRRAATISHTHTHIAHRPTDNKHIVIVTSARCFWVLCVVARCRRRVTLVVRPPFCDGSSKRFVRFALSSVIYYLMRFLRIAATRMALPYNEMRIEDSLDGRTRLLLRLCGPLFRLSQFIFRTVSWMSFRRLDSLLPLFPSPLSRHHSASPCLCFTE